MFVMVISGLGFVCGSQHIEWWVKYFVILSVIILYMVGVMTGRMEKVTLTKWVVLITICVFACTFLRGYYGSQKIFSRIPITRDAIQKLEGHVSTLPKRGERITSALVEVCVLNDQPIPCEPVRVEFRAYENVHFRDHVVLEGKPFRPPNIRGDDGRVFDYRSYLELDGVVRIMRYPLVKIVGKKEGSIFAAKELLFSARIFFVDTISALFPHPYGALVSGLLVGEKSALGKDMEELLRAAGIIHIVVLSGFNVTLIGQFIFVVLFFLPRPLRYFFGVCGILIFCIFAGTAATVVRATCMSLIMLLAAYTYRPYAIGRALALAAFVMVFYDPRIVSDDPSFQLSFLASVGLVAVSRILEKRLGPALKKIPETASLRETLLSTSSTQSTVLPYLVYRMGEVSLVSLLVNVLVLPLIPAAMFFGFISFIGHVLFGKIVALPFVFLTDMILRYVLLVAQLCTKIPGATYAVPGIHLVFMLFGYFFIALIVLLHKEKAQPLVFFRERGRSGTGKVLLDDSPVQ